VVADLVGDDVGLRELAGRAELLLEDLVEAQVDVDLAGPRAVERPHRRLRRPHAVGQLPEKRTSLGAWYVRPDSRKTSVQTCSVLRSTCETNRAAGVVLRRRRRRALLLDGRAASGAGHQAEQRQRVDAEDPAGDHRDDDAADAEAAAADAEAATAAAHAAHVLDVAAFFLAVHAHVDLPRGIRGDRSPPGRRRLSAGRLTACPNRGAV
jgi:hypothetical protein